MKRFLLLCTLVFVLVLAFANIRILQNFLSLYTYETKDDITVKYSARVIEDKIWINTYDGEQETFLTGVNIGLGKPGYYPGDVAISREEYLRWFVQISDMNVNIIRVYTLQSPVFYEALLDFNKLTKEPLYLIQGAYVDEAMIEAERDMWSPDLYANFKNEVKNVIDAVHGNADIQPEKGHASGIYDKDVSPYVISYLMGIEFDGETVTNTNKNHPDKAAFNGEYLYTGEEATPFEGMLASIGDFAAEYETKNYNSQKILAFANWPTTDPLDHPNEPEERNNMDGINVENIKGTPNFLTGMYASYHVYPYYPDFFNFEDQMQFIDKSKAGTKKYNELAEANPYRQYLYRLNQHHQMPVVITEFGVPTSRGVTHVDEHRGFNQGGISETQQGEMIVAMLEDMKEAGLNGGIVFAWQDEWFKRTWNTMEQNTGEGRIRWHDVLTSEQNFGLLDFTPEEAEYSKKPILQEEDYKVFASAGPEYLSFRIDRKDLNLEKEHIELLIDTKKDLGVECKIVLDGSGESRVLVRSEYNPFNVLFSHQLTLQPEDSGTEAYSTVNLRLRNKIYLPQEDKLMEASYYEAGKLMPGEMDGDYYQTGNSIVINVPWLLLNFSDPSTKMVLGDIKDIKGTELMGKELPSISIENIRIGFKNKNNPTEDKISFGTFTWQDWEVPNYEERLKESYYYIKNYLEENGNTEK